MMASATFTAIILITATRIFRTMTTAAIPGHSNWQAIRLTGTIVNTMTTMSSAATVIMSMVFMTNTSTILITETRIFGKRPQRPVPDEADSRPSA